MLIGHNPRVLLYLSKISFTFFMCQVLPLWKISSAIMAYFKNEINVVKILLSFMVCLFGAMFIHHLIEKPIQKYLKTRLL